MTDEQIASEFVRQVRILCSSGEAVSTLVAIIGEARTTERARCVAIVERYADPTFLGLVRIAASEMLGAIEAG